MLQLSVTHARPPIFIYPLDPNPQNSTTTFAALLIVKCDTPTKIGGLKAAWQVSIRRPLAGKSIQIVYEWGKPEVLETIVTNIMCDTPVLSPGEYQ